MRSVEWSRDFIILKLCYKICFSRDNARPYLEILQSRVGEAIKKGEDYRVVGLPLSMQVKNLLSKIHGGCLGQWIWWRTNLVLCVGLWCSHFTFPVHVIFVAFSCESIPWWIANLEGNSAVSLHFVDKLISSRGMDEGRGNNMKQFMCFYRDSKNMQLTIPSAN